MSQCTVFVSYCRADKRALNPFMPFQTTLEREGLITVWTDRQIKPGDRWRAAIEAALAQSRVAILFISEHFLASSFIQDNELPPLLAACEAGRLTVLPVFLSPSTVDQAGISFVHPDTGKPATITLTEFQGFGTPDKTLAEMSTVEKQRVFVDLAKRIRELARQVVPDPGATGTERTPPPPDGNKVAAAAERSPIPPRRQEGGAQPVRDPLRPAVAEENAFRRTDREVRYRRLEQRVAAAIQSSGAVMDLLENRLPQPTDGNRAGRVDAQERAMALMKGIMALPFESGQSVLLDIYNKMEADADPVGIDAIKTTSRLLIPWLYVASRQMEIEQWEYGSLGDIRTIPAGIMAFAEIVLAGIDNREIAWKEISDPLCFPQGFYGANLQPEGGPNESTENSLREDLFKTVKPPAEVSSMGETEKDDAIARRIQWLFSKKGIRVYLIVRMPSGEAADRYKEQIERIKERYPVLAVVMLDAKLIGEHQTLFDEIRSLLL
ncbi:MAG: TIR domain-containing protein [Magnetococcales bacterium]|nr:TIR domain-containing protein [Magnetococcales bacterium]